MKQVLTSNSAEETFAIARKTGMHASRGGIITLSGELGAGKTLFAKGVAAGMGITGDITSPTFSLMELHEGEIPLYHFDLYRIESEAELDDLGFEEYWEGDGVSIVEWPERAGGRLPGRTTRIIIEYTGPESRRITIEHPDN